MSRPLLSKVVRGSSPFHSSHLYSKDLAYRKDMVRASDIYARMGIPKETVSPAAMADLLTKMQLSARLTPDGDNLEVEVPPTRPGTSRLCREKFTDQQRCC